jgi:hypothetical protein
LASILNFFRIRWIICYKQRKLQMWSSMELIGEVKGHVIW